MDQRGQPQSAGMAGHQIGKPREGEPVNQNEGIAGSSASVASAARRVSASVSG